MANKIHVRKNDNVFVLTGKDSGKSGKVLVANSDKGTVIVEGVNMSTRHQKPKGKNQQGGKIVQESPISSSNVMIVCDRCKRPSKIGRKILADGEKIRVCKACGEIISSVKGSK